MLMLKFLVIVVRMMLGLVLSVAAAVVWHTIPADEQPTVPTSW